MEPAVSIVICTYNRAPYLSRTLDSLSSLKYDNFEVIVVNGPSTDDTQAILDRFQGCIKIVNNKEVNLSISRNIGITNSGGEIVAFLDDDAIPDPMWLSQIVQVYHDNPVTGGVGGRVYGPGGDHFQFHNGVIDIWGQADPKRPMPSTNFGQNGPYFNIMMGVNSTFRKDALIAVGGFDEYYEYYHDESDLCLRLIRAGYPVRHHNEAFVHHEFARSHIRQTIYNLNWFPIVKNTVYFGLKNSIGISSLPKRIIMPYLTARKKLNEFRLWKRNGNITREDYKKFVTMWRKGLWRGYVDGFAASRRVRNKLKPVDTFLRYRKTQLTQQSVAVVDRKTRSPRKLIRAGGRLGICLVSQDYPPYGRGGVATCTKVLAEALVSKGHDVHVLTRTLPSPYELINGIHVWRVEVSDPSASWGFLKHMPVTQKNVNYACAVRDLIVRLRETYDIDIVETPLWDYEGLAALALEGVKKVVRVETPLRMAAKTQNWKWNRDLELSAELEKRLIFMADGVIANSVNVTSTIKDLYELDTAQFKPTLIPLAIDAGDQAPCADRKASGATKVLFVGRLEPRKGIDLLLEAFVNVAKSHKDVYLDVVGDNTIPFMNGKTMKQIFESREIPKEIRNRVNFKGTLSDQEVVNAYQACDIFVAPSRYESFGLVYLEAMKYAKPVIGVSVGGIPEVIRDGETGILVALDSVRDLEEALERLITHPEDRRKLGDNARNDVKERFNPSLMAERSLTVYGELLGHVTGV